jgi:hypothetical protein
MGLVRDFTGTYALGFVLLALFALGCLGAVMNLHRIVPLTRTGPA